MREFIENLINGLKSFFTYPLYKGEKAFITIGTLLVIIFSSTCFFFFEHIIKMH